MDYDLFYTIRELRIILKGLRMGTETEIRKMRDFCLKIENFLDLVLKDGESFLLKYSKNFQ